MTALRRLRVEKGEDVDFVETDSEANSNNVQSGHRMDYALPKDYLAPKIVHTQEVRTKNIF
jgi:hypothetical protein